VNDADQKFQSAPSARPWAAFRAALPATFPVFLGYTTIGAAFGLLLASSGLPFWAAPAMSLSSTRGLLSSWASG